MKKRDLYSLRELLTGLLGAELILRRSSWMLLASFMREGCRVKLRLAPGDEKRFLAQFSTDERDSRMPLFLDWHLDVESSRSETQMKCLVNLFWTHYQKLWHLVFKMFQLKKQF